MVAMEGHIQYRHEGIAQIARFSSAEDAIDTACRVIDDGHEVYAIGTGPLTDSIGVNEIASLYALWARAENAFHSGQLPKPHDRRHDSGEAIANGGGICTGIAAAMLDEKLQKKPQQGKSRGFDGLNDCSLTTVNPCLWAGQCCVCPRNRWQRTPGKFFCECPRL